MILGVILLIIWIEFAPLKIGGQASYVLVNGVSMEPNFHGGDLAIVKAASDYGVGDIVTYRDPEMEVYVIHRIIGVQQGRYVIKGDNNSWIDSFHPTRDEILGKLWIHLPKVGLIVNWMRLPINMALIAGILGGVVMAGSNTQPNQHGKKKNKQSEGASAGWLEMALYTLGFLTLVFLALSIYFFTRPATRTADDIEYEQTGVYYYSATSPVGIFDTEIIHSGDPIFTKLTCSIIIGFSYNITGPVQEIAGTQQLIAQIKDGGSGWGRTIPLTAATTFNGTSYSTTAPVDLCQFQSLVKTVGQETGFQPNAYSLVITSKIAVAAKAGGQNVYDSFDSNLVFQFDNVHFYLVKSGENDPLQSSKGGVVTNPNLEANTVGFLGFEFNVPDMRLIGAGGLVLSLLGLLILGWYIFNVTKRSQETLIRIKYGSMIMNVYERDFENIPALIEVTTIEDLAKLAERQNSMILHMNRDFLHYYFVQSDGATYRFVSSENHSRKNNQAVKNEFPQVNILPVKINQNLENIAPPIVNNEQLQTNFIPKKVVISYDGPLPPDEEYDSE